YCGGAHGAIIVYEKSDGDSFGSAKEYYKVIKKETDLKFKMKERPYSFVDMPVILVGLGDGKIVSAEEGQSIVKEWGASGYVEISEIDVQNFENILSSLSLGIITNYQNALKRSPRKLRY
ncbi:MAG: hypothetical protein ACXAAI_13585, partial [Promethearchaeota archaeon]